MISSADTIRAAISFASLLPLGTSSATSTGYRNVTVHDLRAAHQKGALVLDVRTPAEYAAGHVPGAKLIPLQDLPRRAREVPANTTVFVICRSGARSAQASAILAKAGKKDIRNVQGGMNAWQDAKYPITTPTN